MDLNNLYNFKNAVRHFVDIDSLEYPDDVENFNTRELCWTMPISFNVQKGNGKYRTLKIPNILNFVRAYHYYSGLPYFDNVQGINPTHSRMTCMHWEQGSPGSRLDCFSEQSATGCLFLHD